MITSEGALGDKPWGNQWRPILIKALSNLAPLGRNPSINELIEELQYIAGIDMETAKNIVVTALHEGFLEYDGKGYRCGRGADPYLHMEHQRLVDDTRRRTLQGALMKFKNRHEACRYLSMGDKRLYRYYYDG